MTLLPQGRAVAYALHVGPGSSLDATRATLDRSGFGFFNAAGVVHIRSGVIADQLDGAGAIDLRDADPCNDARQTSRSCTTHATTSRDEAIFPRRVSLPPPTSPDSH